MSEETRIPVYHTHPEDACGNLVLYLVRNIAKGEVIQASDVIWADGRPGVHGEPVRCPSCGADIDLMLNDEGIIYATSDFVRRFIAKNKPEDIDLLLQIHKVMTEADGDTPA